MTTEEQIKSLQNEYDSLSKNIENQNKALELQLKIIELRKQQAKRVVPDDIGGQMRFLLEKYGLRTTFYCFIFGMTIVLIGLITPYYLVKDIPFALALFNAGPVLLMGYGVYSIPFVKKWFKDEVVRDSKCQ